MNTMTPARPGQLFGERAGEAWVRLQEQTDAMIDPPGRAALAGLPLSPGQRVLDVGCGCGQTLLEIDDVVGATGSVVGVDVSRPMLARARERTAGRASIGLVLGDAQLHPFAAASVDALYSRFGVMFFADVRAAFANLRRALRPGGRLAFVCWQEMARNPWADVPLRAVMRLLPETALPELLRPGLPGPFSMADAAQVRGVLTDAGFADVTIEPWEQAENRGGAITPDPPLASR